MAATPSTGFDEVLRLLEELGPQKQAAALSEPGGYLGASTHPSADTDDNLITARTGARAAENEQDVRTMREQPSVDSTSAAPAHQSGSGGQDARQLNIGTQQSATGEDPSVEDDFKGDKDDPGTTSVMKADDGQKYAGYLRMDFGKLAAHSVDLTNQLLAALHQRNQPPAAKQAAADPAVLAAAAAAGYADAAQGGYSPDELAEADLLVPAVIKEAEVTAGLIAQFLGECVKAAGDPGDPESGEHHDHPGDASGGAGASAAMGGGPGPDDMGGGDAGGGGLPGPMAGGPGPDPGGDPMGAAAAGAPPEGPTSEEAIQELIAGLMEMGIDPQELAAAAQAVAGGGGPGGPPGPLGGGPGPDLGAAGPAGGPDPTKMARARTIKRAAEAAIAYRRTGRFGFGPPASDKRAALRAQLRHTVAEFLAS